VSHTKLGWVNKIALLKCCQKHVHVGQPQHGKHSVVTGPSTHALRLLAPWRCPCARRAGLLADTSGATSSGGGWRVPRPRQPQGFSATNSTTVPTTARSRAAIRRPAAVAMPSTSWFQAQPLLSGCTAAFVRSCGGQGGGGRGAQAAGGREGAGRQRRHKDVAAGPRPLGTLHTPPVNLPVAASPPDTPPAAGCRFCCAPAAAAARRAAARAPFPSLPPRAARTRRG
jgi:hypothetical protein